MTDRNPAFVAGYHEVVCTEGTLKVRTLTFGPALRSLTASATGYGEDPIGDP